MRKVCKKFLLLVFQRAELNLPPLQAEARLKEDIKAIKTIAMTIAAYFLCYVPSIAFAMAGTAKENVEVSWFGFIAMPFRFQTVP